MRRCRNEAALAAISSYLERRNYAEAATDPEPLSAEQMAVSAIVDAEAARANSILYSCANNDPAHTDRQFAKLVTYVESVEPESVHDELSALLCPLLCHLYLEMLRGGHGQRARDFLEKHSTSLPRKEVGFDASANLPSALYRPSSLERLFHSLQNGAIDGDAPDRDFAYRVLDELAGVFALRDVDSRPLLSAFRSCKYELRISSEAVACLKRYLAKYGHVVLIQVLQTWFHFDLGANESLEHNAHEPPEEEDDDAAAADDPFNDCDGNDGRLCNGHSERSENERELRELREAIQSVRENAPPLKLFTVSSYESSLTCATVDHTCKNLYTGFSNSEIKAWKIGENKTESNGQTVAPSNVFSNGASNVYDASGELELDSFTLRGHCKSVQALKLIESADKCGVLVSASQDTTIRAWRLSDKRCAAIYRGHNYPIWCLDVTKHGIYMASGSYDRTAKLWSLDRTFPLRIFAGHNLDVNTISFHPNGNYLATGSADKTVRLWCVSTGQQVRLFPGHRGSVHSLAFSPDGKLIASAGEDKRIKIWDIASGMCLHDLRGHQNAVTHLEWYSISDSFNKGLSTNGFKNSPDVGILLSCGTDSILRLWDSRFYTHKSSMNVDSIPTLFDCKCSHIVMSRCYADWLIAVGANVQKS